MLRVELIGNLGSDPEQRYTQQGAAVANFRVAVNSRRQGANGEAVERTDWFRVKTMGARADYVARFRKGQRVLVVGRLEISEWQTREGELRTSFDVWADDVVNLSPREDTQPSSGPTAEHVAARPPNGTRGQPDEDFDDLPF